MILLLAFVSVALSAPVQLKLTPNVIAKSGDSVQIAWANVAKACEFDTISLFVEPNTHVELGYLNVSSALGTWNQGFGSVAMRAVNVRAPMRFAYWSRCHGDAKPPVELASAHLTFMDLFEPTQLHLALTPHIDQVRAMFTTARPTPFVPPIAELQALDAQYQPIGTIHLFTGISNSYAAADMCNAPANTSGAYIDVGAIHDVLLTGLLPASIYRYRVGLTNQSMSDWRPFVTPPAVGPNVEVDVLMFGDQGVQTPFTHTAFWMNYGVEQQFGAPGTVALMERYVAEGVPTFLSSAAKRHFAEKGESARLLTMARRWGDSRAVQQPTVTPRLILNIGDISYARGLGLLWEYYLDSVDNAAGSAPFMVGVGNHEQDHPGQAFRPNGTDYGDDSLGECGVPYGNRFHMPSPSSHAVPARQRNLWYSFNFGPIHFTFMSSEHDFLIGSPQYQWLQQDLAAVDRKVTPWLILLSHRPFYSTCAGCMENGISTLLRQQIGPLIYKYAVDLVYVGHVHVWERTCGITQHGVCAPTDEQGTVYVTGGMAGNTYESMWMVDRGAGHVIEPEWSIFRSMVHGVSELRANGTHFEMIYVGSKRGEVHDRFTLRK